jgi:hypothetical protein
MAEFEMVDSGIRGGEFKAARCHGGSRAGIREHARTMVGGMILILQDALHDTNDKKTSSKDTRNETKSSRSF